jgi:hypothetical protein
MARTAKPKKKPAGRRAAKPVRRPAISPACDRALRKHLVRVLADEQAHLGFESVFPEIPPESRGVKVHGAPHTPWQLLEHLRIAQWDILEFCLNPLHVSPPFPAGYWPPTPAPPDPATWDRSVLAFRADLQSMIALVKNPKTDLFARIPHGQGQTILREALLVADHNAYHIGQAVLLLRLAGAWDES